VIEVRDHGPGVPDDEAARIFERFYRSDTSRTRETGGSGLGLAIVAAIVGSHSGTVRVQPTDGGGATLVVSLPFLDEAEAAEGRTEAAEAEAALDTATADVAAERSGSGSGSGGTVRG